MVAPRIAMKLAVPCVLLASTPACTAPNSATLRISNPPIVFANAQTTQGDFVFMVSVHNTSGQPIKAGQFYIMNVAKGFAALPACETGATNYGQEIVPIPALQPNETWKAADKRMMDIASFKSGNCSCKIDKCGGGIMRFTLLNWAQQPYQHAQSDFEVKWEKSGGIGVATDESLVK